MKKGAPLRLAIVGIGLWIWVGSYVCLREFRGTTITLFYPSDLKVVSIPNWAASLTPIYRPLTTVDFWLTGKHIQIARFHIGATANF